MSLYADFANLYGEDRVGDAFHPNVRDHVLTVVEEQCIFQMALQLAVATDDYAPPLFFGGLVEPGFLADVQACLTDDADCTDDAAAYRDQRARGFVPIDADAGPCS